MTFNVRPVGSSKYPPVTAVAHFGFVNGKTGKIVQLVTKKWKNIGYTGKKAKSKLHLPRGAYRIVSHALGVAPGYATFPIPMPASAPFKVG